MIVPGQAPHLHDAHGHQPAGQAAPIGDGGPRPRRCREPGRARTQADLVASITDPEVRTFLTEGTRTAKFAYLSPAGRPFVAPVWFIVEGGDLIFNTGKDTVKGQYLARDRRVSICVDLEKEPYGFV